MSFKIELGFVFLTFKISLFWNKQGDSIYKWNVTPFQMFENGSYWQPPPLNRFTKGCDFDDSYEKVKKELLTKKETHLSTEKNDALNNMLKNLTIERKSISNGMLFCIDNAEKAEEIITSIVNSIKSGNESSLNKIVNKYLFNKFFVI